MSREYSGLLGRLLDGISMTEAQSASLMHALAAGELDPALAGALLAALRAKGETAEEIRGFATAMRELAVHPVVPDGSPIVDTVGTGGDGSGSFNLSTGTGLLAAACGLRVVKHGNRSVSSRSGSADLLERLGMPVPLEDKAAMECLDALGFTFLFAPAFHPAMRSIAPVRQALGVRTVFNLLGPLTNPAAPPYQLIGAFGPEAARLMAETLAGMPIERAFVVHGEPGWDEATPCGEFVLYDVRPGDLRETRRAPEDYGLPRCRPRELAGGDAAHNARALERVFTGGDRGAHRDALLMGTSLVLELTGRAADAKEGVAMAAEALDSGAAERLLAGLRRHFAAGAATG
ncbi:MAG TPA: anthranilate phosphoribosyltransferase [Woeseiaceae bacterium]|nr:anthranilate phosphoribosyltransferase [Woeseiaceae bacterium]